MTIGSDQLDEWGKTLTDCDYLYRELQLLIRINPEAYTVDSDAIAAVGVANEHGREDGDMLHPIVFAKTWAWHLAAAARAIPPITSAWVPLIRYVTAHLQYLGRDDRDAFADDLRRVRGMLGALVNENRLALGEADELRNTNAQQARSALRRWALTTDMTMKRKELNVAFPTLTEREWANLRKRKERSGEDIPAYHYPVKWVAELAPDNDLPAISYATTTGYRDAMRDKDWLSLDHLNPNTVYADRHTGMMVYADKGKRKTQESPESL